MRRCCAILALVAALPFSAAATIIGVFDSADSGPGTLRQAILDANALSGVDEILFSLPPGSLVIAPLSPLPALTETVIVNGTTQPGYHGLPIVELSGINAGPSDGLTVNADDCRIAGLVIYNWSGDGVRIGGNWNFLENCFIGTDRSGQFGLGNGGAGVWVSGSSNWIGGDRAVGNLISANLGDGVLLTGPSSEDNRIEGNYVGTDVTGTFALGQGGSGVALADGAHRTAVVVNVLSGNGLSGLTLSNGVTQTYVGDNRIGCDPDGLEPIANFGDGVWVTDPLDLILENNVLSGNLANGLRYTALAGSSGGMAVRHNAIGCTATRDIDLANEGAGILIEGAGGALIVENVISGNFGPGIELVRAENVEMFGNHLGVGGDGITPVLSLGSGISITDGRNNTIGATNAGFGNVIAFNFVFGVVILGDAAAGNLISGNSIHDNSYLGISLGGGLAPLLPGGADPGDGDVGPNGLQNFPMITSVACDGGQLHINGSLDSAPSRTYVIELFSSGAPDPSGYGEGATWSGCATVVTDGTGHAGFSISVSSDLSDAWFTTTATDVLNRNTSEFGAAVLSQPVINIDRAGLEAVLLSWTTNCGPYVLETTTDLNPPAIWLPSGTPVVLIGASYYATNGLVSPVRFFRLRRP